MSPPNQRVDVVTSAAVMSGPVDVENPDGTTTRIANLDDAARVFGAGSNVWLWFLAHFEGRRPHPPCACGAVLSPRDGRTCASCRDRRDRFLALREAFLIWGQLLAVVEAFGRALYETQADVVLPVPHDAAWAANVDDVATHHRDHAFRQLKVVYARTPELLPFSGDLSDGNGGDW